MTRWLAVALAAAFPAWAGAAPRPKLAVMELRAGQGVEPRAAASLTSVLAADAARLGFDVVAQSDIASMLAFQRQRQVLGCSDDGCLAEIGGALGADLVLSGEVARVGSRAHLTFALLQPRRAAVAARSAGFTEGNDDEVALAALVRFRVLVREVRPDLLLGKPPIERPGAEGLRARRTAAYWTLGAGAALLAGGAVTGLVARGQADDLARSWQRPGYRSLYDTQRRTALTADVLLGAGALATGVGAWLYLGSSVPVVALPVASGSQVGLTVAGRF